MTEATRPLAVIAADIAQNWPKVWYGAVPYLEAMGRLNGIDGRYGYDKASEIVARFLDNAQTWRGPDAQRVKAELRATLKAQVARERARR